MHDCCIIISFCIFGWLGETMDVCFGGASVLVRQLSWFNVSNKLHFWLSLVVVVEKLTRHLCLSHFSINLRHFI